MVSKPNYRIWEPGKEFINRKSSLLEVADGTGRTLWFNLETNMKEDMLILPEVGVWYSKNDVNFDSNV